MTSVSFIIPTHNRPAELARTLNKLDALDIDDACAEVIIADNCSDKPESANCSLATHIIRLDVNLGAAARNRAADRAQGDWLVMLDDDSSPLDGPGMLAALEGAPDDAAVVMADIHLDNGRGRERGGLPEVFIGCGVAIRREAFMDAGGYDHRFGYYAEEYDLAARLLLAGERVVFDPRFVVEHRKVAAGRDMNLIFERLVRNNAWVAQRYAPDAQRRALLRRDRARYRSIAGKEHATAGFARGLTDLRRTLRAQIRSPMSEYLFDRFTGLAHAREALAAAQAATGFDRACIIEPGKNAEVIEHALLELGVELVDDWRDAEGAVPGSMSPGPMSDAAQVWAKSHPAGPRAVCPWLSAHALVDASQQQAA